MAQGTDWRTICPRRDIAILVIVLFILIIFSVLYTTPGNGLIGDNTTLHQGWANRESTTAEIRNYDAFDKDQVVHWSPDWLHQEDIGVMLEERKTRIGKLCKLHPPSFTTENFTLLNRIGHYPNTQYSRSHTSPVLRYCHTAKSGTEFIKHVLRELSANPLYSRPRETLKEDRLRQTLLGDRSESLISFVTIRNPWHRLVSFYLEKFTATEEEKYSTALRYRMRFCNRSIGSIGKNIPTFAQFLQHCILSTWASNQMNIHWEPAVYRCEICFTHFDYIVATEHLNEEFSYILKHEGIVENALEFLKNVRNATIRPIERTKASSSFQDYYHNISAENISTLRYLYREEIQLLGYPDSPFVDSENA